MPLGPGIPSHERRTSSQSMHGNNFMPPTGRGRGFAQTPYGQAMPSPGMGYRQMSNSRPGPQSMPPGQFQQMPPGSPFGRGRNSPAVAHAQPNMQQQQQQQQPYMPGNQQMGYQGYPPMGPQQHQVCRALFTLHYCQSRSLLNSLPLLVLARSYGLRLNTRCKLYWHHSDLVAGSAAVRLWLVQPSARLLSALLPGLPVAEPGSWIPRPIWPAAGLYAAGLPPTKHVSQYLAGV